MDGSQWTAATCLIWILIMYKCMYEYFCIMTLFKKIFLPGLTKYPTRNVHLHEFDWPAQCLAGWRCGFVPDNGAFVCLIPLRWHAVLIAYWNEWWRCFFFFFTHGWCPNNIHDLTPNSSLDLFSSFITS